MDVLRSPVIEYRRCFTDGKILRRGRLFFIEDYYDENERTVKKDTEFRDWARAMVARVRRIMKKRDDGDYMSTGAADSGLRLTAE